MNLIKFLAIVVLYVAATFGFYQIVEMDIKAWLWCMAFSYVYMGLYAFHSNLVVIVQHVQAHYQCRYRRAFHYVSYFLGNVIFWFPATVYLKVRK